MDIHELAKKLKKDFNDDGIVRTLDEVSPRVPVIPCGILYIDWATGLMGFPWGRIIELFGPESSGKTTLSLIIIAKAQKKGYNALFIDAEHSFDPAYAQSLGVDVNRLLFSQPDSGEDALQIAYNTLVHTDDRMIIVIDSIASLVPKSELSGDMEKQTIGEQARLLSKGFRMISSKISMAGSMLICINQIRDKIGVFYGNPEVTPGGKALKHYASMRVEIKPGKKIKSKDKENIGQQTRVTIVKNKAAVPYRRAVYDFMFGIGIDYKKAYLDCLVYNRLAKVKGSTYSRKDNSGTAEEVYNSLNIKTKKMLRKKLYDM